MLISILSRRLKEGKTYVQVGDDDLTEEPPKS